MLEKCAKALKENGFDAEILDTPAEVAQRVMQLIPQGADVGVGGSVTVQSLGLREKLIERGNKVHWHWYDGITDEVFQKAAAAPYYMCSANAITMQGEIVNVDGRGNRVAAAISPANTLIIIAGRNKIAKDYDAAIDRVHNVASPPNAKRQGKKTPCAEIGRCTDCSSPDRMCLITVVLNKAMRNKKIHVLLVDEELGY